MTADTVAFVGRLLRGLRGRRELDDILNAHPRLGAEKVDSAQSTAEQRSLDLDHGSSSSGDNDDERRALAALNESYEAQFPGLRYVVFVNGRSRGEVMQDMRMRIRRADIDSEREAGIAAMAEIANDRLSKLK